MTEWPNVRLGDHVDLTVGFAFKSKEFTENNDDVRLVRGANIGQGSLKWDQERRFPVERYDDFDKYHLLPGDVVLAMDRPWISAGLKWAVVSNAEVPALLVQRVARLRGTDSLAHDFVRYVIGSPQFAAYVQPIVTGVNVPHISASQIEDFTFRLPPFDTQVEISRLLRTHDELIENNRRRIEILDETARLIYREWFAHFRFPGHEDVGLVDSDLGPIPNGWSTETLSDAAHLVMGQSPKSEFYNEDGVGLPFHQGVTNFGTRYPEHKKWCTQESRIAEEGDVLLSVRAPVGRINVAPDRLVIGRGLAALRSKRDAQDFLFETLREVFAVEDSMGGGTIFKAVTKKDLERIALCRPPEPLVVQFERAVGPMFELVGNLTRQNAVLTEARDLLLPRLISGELDVSELELNLDSVA